MSDHREKAIQYSREHMQDNLAALKEFVAIPSVSTDPAHNPDIQKAAEWVADRLRALGMKNVKIYPTVKHPVVYGEWLEVNVPIAIAALKQAWIDFQPTAEVIKDIFKGIGDVLSTVFNWLKIHVPKAVEATRQAVIDAQPTLEIIRGIFEDIGTVLGVVWDWLSEKIPAAVNAAKGAFEGAASAIQGVIDRISGAIDKIRSAIDALRDFLGLSGGVGTGPAGSVSTGPGGQPAVVRPPGGWPITGPGGARGNSTNGAGMSFSIVINAAGGNPQAVAVAAQQGVMAAARSMGLA